MMTSDVWLMSCGSQQQADSMLPCAQSMVCLMKSGMRA
jgi:hypothetical protein